MAMENNGRLAALFVETESSFTGEIKPEYLHDLLSIVMSMTESTDDRGLLRYLFNAIDNLGAAELYIRQYPKSEKLRKFWEARRFNENLK